MDDCTHCGSDVTRYDPIAVRDYEADASQGQFCTVARLRAHVEAADLVVGDACEWPPARE